MADERAPEAKTEAPAPKPQRDLRQEITDRLVQSLDQGRIPWDRPWQNLVHGLPRNMATGREYRGGNRFMLMMALVDNAYADPRFGTVQQINALGGRVKKGEHGYPIEVWKEQPFWERKDISVTLNGMRVKIFGAALDGSVQIGMPTDQASTLNVKTSDLHIVQHKNGQNLSLDWKQAKELDCVVCRTYTVFNAEQCTGLKIEPLPKLEPRFDIVQRGEQIKAAMERDGLTFAEHPRLAFYSPKRDEVSLPPRGHFADEKGYYGTLLHEIGHATGAEKRLNRVGITGGHRFGSEGYAREELRAEIFSMMMAAETGIPHDPQQHIAYVQSWAKVLKQDKNEIFRAAAEASKAVDYVLDKERSLQMMREQTAEIKRAQQLEVSPLTPSPGPQAGDQKERRESAMTRAYLLLDGWAGITEHPVKIIDETPKRYRVRLLEGGFALPSRRYAREGDIVLVPKHAVRQVKEQEREQGQVKLVQERQAAAKEAALAAEAATPAVSPERQSEQLAQIEAKAQPGAQVGPFVIGAPTPQASACESAVQNFVRGGEDKPKLDEHTAEKSSEPDRDKPDRSTRPRLRQVTRKAAAMER